MTNRRALFVGVNTYQNYPGNRLNGCVNDANDMATVYGKLLGFETSDYTILTDAQATKAAIMDELADMVAAAKAGKHDYLVFSMSSHGTQVPDKHADEPDHYDEAFCPHDLAEAHGEWDPKHLILDDELHDLLVQLPPHVLVEVYLDTCHSGSGVRAMDLRPDRRPRYIAPPSLEACEKVVALMPFGLQRRLERSTKSVILFAACRANQTSADAYIAGSYHGAFTYYWCQEILGANGAISRANHLKKVNLDLSQHRYTQVAQLECDATARKRAIKPEA